jgi:hypothetical protein
MTRLTQTRASRYGVSWPVRIRTSANGQWSIGTSVNLSISGVLVDVRRQWCVGEVLELELDFPFLGATPQTVGAIGYVSRTDGQTRDRAAIQFEFAAVTRVSRGSAERGTPRHFPI